MATAAAATTATVVTAATTTAIVGVRGDPNDLAAESGRALSAVAGREPAVVLGYTPVLVGPPSRPPGADQVAPGYEAHIALINEYSSPLVFNPTVAYEHGDEYNFTDTYMSFAQEYDGDEESRRVDAQHVHIFSPGRFEIATSLQPFVDRLNEKRTANNDRFDPTTPMRENTARDTSVWQRALGNGTLQTAKLFSQLNAQLASTLVRVDAAAVPVVPSALATLRERRGNTVKHTQADILPALGSYAYSQTCIAGVTDTLVDIRATTAQQLARLQRVSQTSAAQSRRDLKQTRTYAYAALEKALTEYDGAEESYGIIRFDLVRGGYYIRTGLQKYDLRESIDNDTLEIELDGVLEQRPSIPTPYVDAATSLDARALVALQSRRGDDNDDDDNEGDEQPVVVDEQRPAATSVVAEAPREKKRTREQSSARRTLHSAGLRVLMTRTERKQRRKARADLANLRRGDQEVEEIEEERVEKIEGGEDDSPVYGVGVEPTDDVREVIQEFESQIEFNAESPVVFGADDLKIYGHVVVQTQTARQLIDVINTHMSTDTSPGAWKVVAEQIVRLAVFYKIVPKLFSDAFDADASNWLVATVVLIRASIDRATAELVQAQDEHEEGVLSGAIAQNEVPAVFWLTFDRELTTSVETNRSRGTAIGALIASATQTRDLTMKGGSYPLFAVLNDYDRALAVLDEFAETGRWQPLRKAIPALASVPLAWTDARELAIVEPEGGDDDDDEGGDDDDDDGGEGDGDDDDEKDVAQPTGWLVDHFAAVLTQIQFLCTPDEHNPIANIKLALPGTDTAYMASVIAAAAETLSSNNFAEVLLERNRRALEQLEDVPCEQIARLGATLYDTGAAFSAHEFRRDFGAEDTSTSQYLAVHAADGTVDYDTSLQRLRRQIYSGTTYSEWRAPEVLVGDRREIELLYVLTPLAVIDWCARGLERYGSTADPIRKSFITIFGKSLASELNDPAKGPSERLAGYYAILDNLVRRFSQPGRKAPVYDDRGGLPSVDAAIDASLQSFWVLKEPVMQISIERLAPGWLTTLPFGVLPCNDTNERALSLVWLGLASERQWDALGYTNAIFNLPRPLSLPFANYGPHYQDYRVLLAVLARASNDAKRQLQTVPPETESAFVRTKRERRAAELRETGLQVRRLETSVRHEMLYVHAGRTMWFEDALIHPATRRFALAIETALGELIAAIKQQRYIAAIDYSETNLPDLSIAADGQIRAVWSRTDAPTDVLPVDPRAAILWQPPTTAAAAQSQRDDDDYRALDLPVGSHKRNTIDAIAAAQAFFEDQYLEPIRDGILPEVLALNPAQDAEFAEWLDLVEKSDDVPGLIAIATSEQQRAWVMANQQAAAAPAMSTRAIPFARVERLPGKQNFRVDFARMTVAEQSITTTTLAADLDTSAARLEDALIGAFAQILGARAQIDTPPPGEDVRTRIDAAIDALTLVTINDQPRALALQLFSRIEMCMRRMNGARADVARLDAQEKAQTNEARRVFFRSLVDSTYDSVMYNDTVREFFTQGEICGMIENSLVNGEVPFVAFAADDARVTEARAAGVRFYGEPRTAEQIVRDFFEIAKKRSQPEYQMLIAIRDATRKLATDLRAFLGDGDANNERVRETIAKLRSMFAAKADLGYLIGLYPLDDTLRRLLLGPAVERARVALYEAHKNAGQYVLAHRADVPQSLRIDEIVKRYCLSGWLPFCPSEESSLVYNEFVALRDTQATAARRDALALSQLVPPAMRRLDRIDQSVDYFRVTDGTHHQMPFGGDLILSALWLRLMRFYISLHSSDVNAPKTVENLYLESTSALGVRKFVRDHVVLELRGTNRIIALLQLIFAPHGTPITRLPIALQRPFTDPGATATMPPLDEMRAIDVRAIGLLVFGVDYSLLRGRDDDDKYRVERDVDSKTGAPIIDPDFIYRRGVAAKEVLIDAYYRAVATRLYQSTDESKPVVIYSLPKRVANDAVSRFAFNQTVIESQLNAATKYGNADFLPPSGNSVFGRTELLSLPKKADTPDLLLFRKLDALLAYETQVRDQRFDIAEAQLPQQANKRGAGDTAEVRSKKVVRTRLADFQPVGDFASTTTLGDAVLELTKTDGKGYLSASRTLFTALARYAIRNPSVATNTERTVVVHEAPWHYVPRCVLIAALFRMYESSVMPMLKLLFGVVDTLVRKIDNAGHLLYDDVLPAVVPAITDNQPAQSPPISINLSADPSAPKNVQIQNVRPTAISVTEQMFPSAMATDDNNDSDDEIDPRRGRRARTGASEDDEQPPQSMQSDARAALPASPVELVSRGNGVGSTTVGDLVALAPLNNIDAAGWIAHVETHLAQFLLGRGAGGGGTVRLLPLGDISPPVAKQSLLEYASARLYGSASYLNAFVGSTLLPMLRGEESNSPLQTLLRRAEQWRSSTYAAPLAATGFAAVREAQRQIRAQRRADNTAPNWAELFYDALAQHFELQTHSQTIEQLLHRHARTDERTRQFLGDFYDQVLRSPRSRPRLTLADLRTFVHIPHLLQLLLLNQNDTLVRNTQLHPLMSLLVAATDARPVLRFVSFADTATNNFQTQTAPTGLVYPGGAQFTGAEIVDSLANMPAEQLMLMHEFVPLTTESAHARREYVIVSRIERQIAAPAVPQNANALYYQTLAQTKSAPPHTMSMIRQ